MANSIVKEKHTEFIQLRVAPMVKEAAKKKAKEEGKTLSNYIESLIIQDAKIK